MYVVTRHKLKRNRIRLYETMITQNDYTLQWNSNPTVRIDYI